MIGFYILENSDLQMWELYNLKPGKIKKKNCLLKY